MATTWKTWIYGHGHKILEVQKKGEVLGKNWQEIGTEWPKKPKTKKQPKTLEDAGRLWGMTGSFIKYKPKFHKFHNKPGVGVGSK